MSNLNVVDVPSAGRRPFPTGYRYHERRLWLTGDPARVYVRTSDGVEAWPLVKAGTPCA